MQIKRKFEAVKNIRAKKARTNSALRFGFALRSAPTNDSDSDLNGCVDLLDVRTSIQPTVDADPELAEKHSLTLGLPVQTALDSLSVDDLANSRVLMRRNNDTVIVK